MSEMIKRVARALCAIDGHDPDGIGGDFFDRGLVHWLVYQPEARAAIEAMREPTADMLESGGTNFNCNDRMDVAASWPIMIDAALQSASSHNPKLENE